MKPLACIFAFAMLLLTAAPPAPAMTSGPSGHTITDSARELFTITISATGKQEKLKDGRAGVQVAQGVFDSFRWSK